MEQIINNLKNKEIIYKESVAMIKNYIRNKYPEASDAYRAQVFTDAVHKIIDDHLREFGHDDQQRIKLELLMSAASKKNFKIVAYDIMKSCVVLDINESIFMDHLNRWINRQQDIPVNRNQLFEMAERVREETLFEAVTEMGIESIDPEEGLLEQLESALVYEASYSTLSGDLLPELYTQGEVNEAYEAELRNDSEKDTSMIAQSEENVFETSDISVGTDIERHPQAALEHEHDNDSIGVEDTEDEEVSHQELSVTMENQPDERPSRRIIIETEPYFSETPEQWSELQTKKRLMDEVRDALAGKNNKKLVLLLLLTVAGFAAAVWLIYFIVFGRFDVSDEMSETDIEMTASAVTDMHAIEVGAPVSLKREATDDDVKPLLKESGPLDNHRSLNYTLVIRGKNDKDLILGSI